MNVAKDFDFESYNKRRKEVAEAFIRGESKEAQPEEPALNAGWEGMADPRDVFVDCRSELLDFFKEFTEENVKRLLSTVLIVVQDSDAVEKNIVLGNTWSKNQKAILIDWLEKTLRIYLLMKWNNLSTDLCHRHSQLITPCLHMSGID
jgi:hypothetical protein